MIKPPRPAPTRNSPRMMRGASAARPDSALCKRFIALILFSAANSRVLRLLFIHLERTGSLNETGDTYAATPRRCIGA